MWRKFLVVTIFVDVLTMCRCQQTPFVPASVEPSPLVSDIISRLNNFTWINTMLPQVRRVIPRCVDEYRTNVWPSKCSCHQLRAVSMAHQSSSTILYPLKANHPTNTQHRTPPHQTSNPILKSTCCHLYTLVHAAINAFNCSFNELKDGSGPIDPIGVSVASRKHNQVRTIVTMVFFGTTLLTCVIIHPAFSFSS